ncbi:DNA polymerase beta subunit [[Actinobacillus] muris]|uniref:DNA polymerase beta subunit n=1 Tax=Muribacter muris TaxID=67855 RepID=A0A0J5P5U8_9PAST|nr:nucleotidyltransferase domain-containing protein [Muribacter muris]KMK51150.1 DNA polymerase beta subunit [[Actinobacillus] muris] [Muribacter muris]
MSKLAIQPEHLAIVKGILQREIPQYTVWAFGSRVKNTAKPYSDLDLAIISEQPLNLATLANLSKAFSESDLPWKVDIVDWAITSGRFREIICKQYVVLQG